MPYELGFALRGRKLTSRAFQPTASAALQAIRMLSAHGEYLKYITAPEGHKLSLDELRQIAELEQVKPARSFSA